MSRVLVVGWDGATWDLLEPWVRAGSLPVLAAMMSGGVYGRLRSVLPVLSSAAWASFMTGANPGKHGVFDFVRRDPDSYRLRVQRRDHIRQPSLWRILSQNGFRVGVVNVPMTYPPEQVNGFLISGLGTPNYRPFTYPAELGPDLLARGYRVNRDTAYQPGREAGYLHDLYSHTDNLVDTTLWLMGERDWDLFMVVFRDTDELSHYFWRHMDPTHPAHDPVKDARFGSVLMDYFRRLDGVLGQLIECSGPETTVILLSDHGAGPLYKDVFLNEWLRQQGYLVAHQPGANGEVRRALARLGLTRSNVSMALRTLRLGRVEDLLKTLLGERIDLLPRTSRVDFPDAIDWSQTRAYSFGYHGQIYINLQGREPQGIVKPGADYARLCAELMQSLRGLVDPEDGKPVVDQVLHRDDIFHGPFVGYAPDLTLIMRDFAYITRHGFEFGGESGQVFTQPHTNESGSHRLDGILSIFGPAAGTGGSQAMSANLIDVGPTILRLLGCPVPEEMDGRVLENWIASHPSDKRREVDNNRYEEPGLADWSDDEEREVMARLRQLGYLE